MFATLHLGQPIISSRAAAILPLFLFTHTFHAPFCRRASALQGRKQKAESRKQKAESRKQEAESRKQEAGSRKQEAGSRKQEAAFP